MSRRRTKIVCTIGPACETEEGLRKLVRAGMNVARLNFSHGTHEWHRARIASIRKVALEEGVPVAVLQDLCGPKLRLGTLPTEGVTLEVGSSCWLVPTGTPANDADTFPSLEIPIPGLLEQLQPGHPVYLRDAQLHLEVVQAADPRVLTRVVTGGTIFSRQGITVPTVRLPIAAATPKDLDDLRAAGGLVDWVALSFVREAADLHPVRELLREIGSPARLMAKIEKPESLDNLQEIIDAADGILIARGDLGVEIPIQTVPVVQKRIVTLCNRAGKPVITATQMLESMMTSPRPTRSEVTDVANAVLDGTDAVMLSGETAAGNWPDKVVSMMHETVLSAEGIYPYERIHKAAVDEATQDPAEAMIQATCALGADLDLAAILCWTDTGEMPLRLARTRPRAPILAVTSEPSVHGRLALSWGVEPVLVEGNTSVENRLKAATDAALRMGCQPGQLVAIMVPDLHGLRSGRLLELVTL